MAKFEKGDGRPRKPKGATNKVTKTIKEAVFDAFTKLQDDPKANLLAWGQKNPTMFYQVAAKLIPTEISAKVEATVIKVVRE